jgi:hypothetical protein
MTKKEYSDENIGLTFDFVRHAIEHPEILKALPDGAELDFMGKEIPLKRKVLSKKKKIARYRVGHTFEPAKALRGKGSDRVLT